MGSPGANKLPFEVENYNASTGQIIAWVQVPTLSHTSDTIVYMFYGNSAIGSSQANAPGVWDSNYKGVWHLKDGSTLSAADSTSNANNGTITSATATSSGEVGGAASFNGSASIDTGTAITATSPITVSAWANPSILGGGMQLVSKGYDGTNTQWQLRTTDGASRVGWSTYNGVDVGITGSTATLPVSQWSYVVGTYDGTTWRLYINANPDSSKVASGPIATSRHLDIGAVDANGAPTQTWSGAIDEVRVSTIARSQDWITMEYQNQLSPTTFVSVGVEQ